MPRYSFRIVVGTEIIEDDEGVELPDRHAAIHHALIAMREMLGEDIRAGRLDLSMRLELLDATGMFHVTDCTAALATRADPDCQRA